jgi:cytochrome oxidase Cu insertion factor (SCO1/SenC/PrrC family)
MEKMCRVVDIIDQVKLEKSNEKIQALFVSVDPDRDDYKAVDKYVKGKNFFFLF